MGAFIAIVMCDWRGDLKPAEAPDTSKGKGLSLLSDLNAANAETPKLKATLGT